MTSITVAYTTPSGNTFTYTVTGHTRRCWSIEAQHTGEIRQYASKQALRSFCRRLADHLATKYPAAETVGELVAASAAREMQYA